MTARAKRYRTHLKWAGSKLILKDRIGPLLLGLLKVHGRRAYCEPCLGAGHVFLWLRRNGYEGPCFLSDFNPHVIAFWEDLRDHGYDIYAEAALMAPKPTKETYLRIREEFKAVQREGGTDTVRFLWLNKHGFNGMFRVNKRGLFNIPYGGPKHPEDLSEWNVVWPEKNHVRDIIRFLKGEHGEVHLRHCSFDQAVVPSNSVIYVDPPYSETFNAYTPGGFPEELQHLLIRWVRANEVRGCSALVSNSPAMVAEYEKTAKAVLYLEKFYPIASKVERRKMTKEILGLWTRDPRAMKALDIIRRRNSA